MDGITGWDNWDAFEQEIFWLNITKNKSQQWIKPITNYGDLPVDNTSFLVQISNTFSDLQDNVTRKSLRKVGELDDLME